MKHKLEIEYEYDFLLFGIVCHEKDYRFLWSVNNALGLDFAQEKDVVIKEKGALQATHFSVFHYTDEEMFTEYYIITNKGENNVWLLPEQKKADFFLQIKGEVFDELKDDLLRRLRAVNNVILVYEIDPSILRSKQNLIF